MYIEQRW